MEWRKYSVVQKNSSMFEFAAFLLPTNIGPPMHSQSALAELPSPNLAPFLLLDPVDTHKIFIQGPKKWFAAEEGRRQEQAIFSGSVRTYEEGTSN